MPELEPITRKEKIISGEDLTPITREEMFLKQYGGGDSTKSIMIVEGEKNQQGTSVTLNKTFTEMYNFISNGGNTIIVIVNGLPYAGDNYFMLSDLFDEPNYPKQLNFHYIDISTVSNGVKVQTTNLAISDSEDNIARVNKVSGVIVSPVELSDTLEAGDTELILYGDISTSNTFDIYTSIYGEEPTSVSVATGSITLTFDALETDMDVKVRVS